MSPAASRSTSSAAECQGALLAAVLVVEQENVERGATYAVAVVGAVDDADAGSGHIAPPFAFAIEAGRAVR